MSTDDTAPSDDTDAQIDTYDAGTDAESDSDEPEVIDNLQNLKADRDEHGNRVPEAVYVDELGAAIEVLQPTQDEVEEYIEPYFADGDVDNDHLAEMFEALFPAFDSVTAEDINDMTTQKAQGLLVAILMRAERERAVKLLRGEIDDEFIDQAKKAAELQEAAEPGNR